MTADQLMTIEEVATFLRVPVGTLYQWRYKGTGPKSVRVGRHVRYRQNDVQSWLEGLFDPPAFLPRQRRPAS
jgi:excisionase family DNA binding protein